MSEPTGQGNLDEYTRKILEIYTRPKRVLIVDDSKDDCMLMERLSKNYQCEVSECGTAEEALQLSRSNEYHLIIIDIRLPGMDGIALLGKLKEEARSTGVCKRMMLLSGEYTMDMLSRIRKLGCVFFIYKPELFTNEFVEELLTGVGILKKAT